MDPCPRAPSIWAPARAVVAWRRGSESNRRTRLCRPLHDHSATPPKQKKRAVEVVSVHLPWNSGAGKEVRTPDLNLGKVALYQLSYSRVVQQATPGVTGTPLTATETGGGKRGYPPHFVTDSRENYRPAAPPQATRFQASGSAALR